MKKLIPIDFEYTGTNEAILTLICCSFEVEGKTYEYWLLDQGEFNLCKVHLKNLRDEGYIFVCWNAVAEGQSFLSMRLNPLFTDWIDVHAEWKMLTNHNNKWSYGKQLVDGKVVNIEVPKYGDTKFKAKTNLSAGLYKLLNVKIDTDHKTLMRDICIRGDKEELEENKQAIMDYCTSDIKYLIPAWEVIKNEYKSTLKVNTATIGTGLDDHTVRTIDNTQSWCHVHARAEAMLRTAFMTFVGYPVNRDKVNNFQNSVKPLLKDLAEDINSKLDNPIFRWNKSQDRYSVFQKPIKEWVINSEYYDRWELTDTQEVSLSLKSFEKHFSYRHDFPDTLPAQYMRYLKVKKSLNGFLPVSPTAKDKTIFTDKIGKDSFVRSWLNPYGSQSSRFQPAAKFFIPLKSSWMRSLIEPPEGKVMISSDYKSEEFLLGGLISGDENMLKAYESGDVYLYFAKLAGAVPWNGLKKDYKKERDLFKSTTLGISYLMGPVSLAAKLTADTGDKYTKKDAKELIAKFKKAYPKYTEWQDEIYQQYKDTGAYKLPCGWVMFGDNNNDKSCKNLPVQGLGGSIIRKAIALAQDRGLEVCYPLHDALYIICDLGNEQRCIDVLINSMRDAFAFYFKGDTRYQAMTLIKFDTDVWGQGLKEGNFTTPCNNDYSTKKIYIDERGKSEYEKFKKFL